MNHQTQREKTKCDFSAVRRAGRNSCWNTPLDRKATDKNLDKFLGCLSGGAAGDALGYAVDFCGNKPFFSDTAKTVLKNTSFKMALAGFPMTPK